MWTRATPDIWDHGSITTKFYRMKASDAPKFLETLSDNERRILESDEQRLKRIRARLAKDRKGSSQLEEIRVTLRDWRREASARSPPRVLDSPEARAEGLKPDLCPEFDARQHEEQDNFTLHEVKASVMYFQQSIDGLGWKGVSPHVEDEEYLRGSLREQEIPVYQGLFEQENEGIFKTECDQDGRQLLKYIHLPANHQAVSYTDLGVFDTAADF